ncbi:hypothetical protein N7491_006314 [Penicillium cf. griseofulvum]|nr:hypothetical protein N7491_006314 [Penicillium cf. griseofulvum]
MIDPDIITVPRVYNFFIDDEVEEWFNSRLFPGDGKVRFDHTPLVLYHLDIAPRNIIWLDDGRVCLLDWASAGFYPRLLEFASLFFQEYHFSEMLLKAVGFGSGCDKEEQQRICQALYNNERYSFCLTQKIVVRGTFEKDLRTIQQLVASFLFHHFRNHKNFRLDRGKWY